MDLYPDARGGCCSPPTPTPAPRSTRSTSSTSTTTCSSRGTRRRRSSTRSSTTLLEAWRRPTTGAVPETKVVGHRWSARSSRGARVPGPQPGALPLVLRPTSPRAQRLLDGRRGRRPRAAGGRSPPTATALVDADRRRAGRPRRADHHAGRATSTTSSSSAAARPGSARRCTARPRACAPCWSSAPPPAARPGRARASRTTSASPTACPARQLTDRARRQALKFGAEVHHRPATSSASRSTARPAPSASPTATSHRRAHRHPGHRRLLPAARRARARRAHRPRRLLRLGADRGAPTAPSQDVYIVGGANSAGPGRRVLRRGARSR